MSVRAKVRLVGLEVGHGDGTSVIFKPVSGDSPENKEFYQYTPGGEFRMTLSPKAAQALASFTLGKEYFVDFTPVQSA